jgi:hypothetical protein
MPAPNGFFAVAAAAAGVEDAAAHRLELAVLDRCGEGIG